VYYGGACNETKTGFPLREQFGPEVVGRITVMVYGTLIFLISFLRKELELAVFE
jgi:hypothetical protein